MDIEQRAVWPLLELRQVGRTVSGAFRYGATATMRDRGRVRKESFGPRAFQYAVEEAPEREIHLLAGHSFDRPLASRRAGTLELEDSPTELRFRATLPEEDAQPTYMVDTVKQLRAGLIAGVSPGFRVPPRNVVPGAEELVDEPGTGGAVQIRRINHAVLYELSLVSRPAYEGDATEVDVRSFGQDGENRPVVWRPRIWL